MDLDTTEGAIYRRGVAPIMPESRPSDDRRGTSIEARLTEQLTDSITADHVFAQDEAGRLYHYELGVYHPGGDALVKRLVKARTRSLQIPWRKDLANEV